MVGVNPLVLEAIDVTLGIGVAVLLVPTATLLMQTLGAALGKSRVAPQAGVRRSTIAVLIPAHNEASCIRETLDSIRPQLATGDRMVVIADNCTDDTAGIAMSSGAQLVERADATRRGKGFALDYGIRHLRRDPPGIVLVIDADCIMTPGSLRLLGATCERLDRPIQSLYLMQANRGRDLGSRVSEFGWAFKNYVRPLGMKHLGAPCQLMGSGMAFPWGIIARASLASSDLVEDLRLGLELAELGDAPFFCEQALVTSCFPANRRSRMAQLTRWEQGHLATVARQLPRLLWLALRERNCGLAALALDLSVPPLAWLVCALCWCGTLGGILILAGASAWPAFAALAGILLIASAVAISWWQVGRRSLSFIELLMAPVYAMQKLPIYVSFFNARETRWIRTDRDDDA